MKKCLTFFMLFLALSSLWGQWILERETFIPPEYYVGDSVLLEVVLRSETPSVLELPQEFPQLDWLEVDSISLDQQGDLVLIKIAFRSYYPGARALPDLNFGSLTLGGITLFTSSMSEQLDVRDIRGLRDPFLLPGSIFFALLGLLLLLGLPPGLFFLIRFVWRRVAQLLKRMRLKAPYRRFIRTLQWLSLPEQMADQREFYTGLTAGLRAYLSERTQMDYSSCTTRELSSRGLNGASPQDWKKVIHLLKQADLVKYAGADVQKDQMVQDLSWIEDFTKHWEEEERHAYL